MNAVAVLASGGVDSSILIADMSHESTVFPIYVRAGLVWEEAEQSALESFIAALDDSNVQPLTVLSVPVKPLLGDMHWSVSGDNVPDAEAPDEAMFIPGRNILLISLASVWCSTHDVSRIAIGSLGGNPFPDATPAFFRSFGDALSEGLGHRVTVEAPYRDMHKDELIRTHADLPLRLTLTCAQPQDSMHCGDCNKCRERQLAFEESGVDDRTVYAIPRVTT